MLVLSKTEQKSRECFDAGAAELPVITQAVHPKEDVMVVLHTPL